MLQPENQKEMAPDSVTQDVEKLVCSPENAASPVVQPPDTEATDPLKIQRALSRRTSFGESRQRAREAEIKRQQEQDAADPQLVSKQQEECKGWMVVVASITFFFFPFVPGTTYTLFYYGPQVRECGENLYNAQWWIWVYIMQFFARSILTILLSCCGYKCFQICNACFWICFLTVDAWGLLAVNVYVRILLNRPHNCTQQQLFMYNKDWQDWNFDWSVGFVNTLLFVFNIAVLLLSCGICCVAFDKYCFLPPNQDNSIDRRSTEQSRGTIINRVQGAMSAIELLDKKKRSYEYDTDKSKRRTCLFCSKAFQDTDEVVELECDDRHIFHYECISKWMKKKTECPICRQNVV